MQKKTVLMVHNYYQIGGGEHTVFENERNLLLENGHEVYVYTRSNDELKKSKWKLLLLPFTTIWSCKTYFETRNLIRKNRIEVVHCHNTFPLISPSVYYAARSLKVPVIQTIHNFRFLCPNGLFYCNGNICEKCREQRSFLPALKNGCYRNSKLQTAVVAAMLGFHRLIGTYKKISYIFLTEFNKGKFSDLIDIHGNNVFVKSNFVNSPTIRPAVQKKKAVFVYAGRLDKNKGIPFLLKVWPQLPKEYILHIYGDGPYREACESADKQYENIHFFGFCSQEAIFSDLAEAMALLFPSECYEGFPMTLSESFSLSRPVIATNKGNHGELINMSGGGCTFQSGNEVDFIETVNKVATNNIAYSQNALRYFEMQLTREENYRKLSEIYDQVEHIQ